MIKPRRQGAPNGDLASFERYVFERAGFSHASTTASVHLRCASNGAKETALNGLTRAQGRERNLPGMEAQRFLVCAAHLSEIMG